MKKPSFWRNFLRGVAFLFGWNLDRRSYEERFGMDEELLASDWKKVGDDIELSADALIGRAHTEKEGKK